MFKVTNKAEYYEAELFKVAPEDTKTTLIDVVKVFINSALGSCENLSFWWIYSHDNLDRIKLDN